jgi:hypothetical protein
LLPSTRTALAQISHKVAREMAGTDELNHGGR